MTARGLTFAPRGHSGLTPKECTIMADWDAGLSMRAIARRHGFNQDSVRRTVSYYDGASERPEFNRAATRASQQLAAAIARAFPERTSA